MPNQPLKIAVVGAGLGGLAAAFCFAHDGYAVDVYERKAFFDPRGGGIMVRPTASRLLKQWGLADDFDQVSDLVTAMKCVDAMTGELLVRRPEWASSGDGTPNWSTTRRETQEILYRRAVEQGVRFHFGVLVAAVSEKDDFATVTLDPGRSMNFDLVLAADGILSRLRPQFVSDAPQPEVGSSTFYQITTTGDELLGDEDTKQLLQVDDELQIWFNRDGGAYAVGRCKKNLSRFSAAFGIPEVDDSNPRLWDESGDLEYVRERFKDYHPSLTALLRIVKSCDRWRLAELPDLSRWVSAGGRRLLLGDSAHAMYPATGFGFSSIVEDIGVLSHLLREHRELGLPRLTDIWQQVRMPRVNRLKAWAKANHQVYAEGAGSFPAVKSRGQQQEIKASTLDEIEPDMEGAFHGPAFLKWALGFDVIADVQRRLE